MDLLVVRHADAGDAKDFAARGQSDDLRPLSDKGRVQMRMAALAVRGLVPGCQTITSSPLLRAVETAEILCKAYGVAAPQTTEALIPGAALADFEQWARQFDDSGCMAAVGHEPHLSSLVTWLMMATTSSRIALKKGAACLVSFDGRVRSGAGTLQWLLTPQQLSKIAGV